MGAITWRKGDLYETPEWLDSSGRPHYRNDVDIDDLHWEFFYKVVFLNPLTLLAALLYLTTVITVLVKIARYCTQGHHVLVKLIIRGIVYVFIPFCIFEATLVLHTWSVHSQVMRNSGWYPLTEIVWCFFTVIGCVISEAIGCFISEARLLAVRAKEGPDIEEDADAGS